MINMDNYETQRIERLERTPPEPMVEIMMRPIEPMIFLRTSLEYLKEAGGNQEEVALLEKIILKFYEPWFIGRMERVRIVKDQRGEMANPVEFLRKQLEIEGKLSEDQKVSGLIELIQNLMEKVAQEYGLEIINKN